MAENNRLPRFVFRFSQFVSFTSRYGGVHVEEPLPLQQLRKGADGGRQLGGRVGYQTHGHFVILVHPLEKRKSCLLFQCFWVDLSSPWIL